MKSKDVTGQIIKFGWKCASEGVADLATAKELYNSIEAEAQARVKEFARKVKLSNNVDEYVAFIKDCENFDYVIEKFHLRIDAALEKVKNG